MIRPGAEQSAPPPSRPPIHAWRLVNFVVVSLVCIAFAHLVDMRAARVISYARYYEITDAPSIAEQDWMRLIRVVGSVWFWLALGVCFALIDAGRRVELPLRDMWSRAMIVLLAAGAGGLCAEGLKIVFQRTRPGVGPTDDAGFPVGYLWRWAEGTASWSGGGLGLPSSHAATAAAGLCALAFVHPRLAPVCALFAVLAALSRVASEAHFLSDVTLGGAVGVACAWAVWRVHLAIAYPDTMRSMPT